MSKRPTIAQLESNIRGLQQTCNMNSAAFVRVENENKALIKEVTRCEIEIRWLRQMAQSLSEAIRTRS